MARRIKTKANKTDKRYIEEITKDAGLEASVEFTPFNLLYIPNDIWLSRLNFLIEGDYDLARYTTGRSLIWQLDNSSEVHISISVADLRSICGRMIRKMENDKGKYMSLADRRFIKLLENLPEEFIGGYEDYVIDTPAYLEEAKKYNISIDGLVLEYYDNFMDTYAKFFDETYSGYYVILRNKGASKKQIEQLLRFNPAIDKDIIAIKLINFMNYLHEHKPNALKEICTKLNINKGIVPI